MIGGDISMMCRGQAEAKDEFLKSYDLSKPKTWIIGEDANNL